MAVTSAVLSVDDFARLPRPAGGVRQELHHGELVELPPVKKLHTKLQKRLVSLLETTLDPAQFAVDKEFPFRPAPEYEVWIADVALFSLALWEQTPDDDYFRGVPTIVIEVGPDEGTDPFHSRERRHHPERRSVLGGNRPV